MERIESIVERSDLKPHRDSGKILHSVQDGTCKDLADYGQQKDAPVVIAVIHVPFVFVQGDNVTVSNVLRHFHHCPAQADSAGLSFTLDGDELWWNAIKTRGLPSGQAVFGLAQFLLCGKLVQLCHAGQAIDGF